MTFVFIRREVLPAVWRPSHCRDSPVTSLVTSCCSPEVTARCFEVSTATWSTSTSPVTRMVRCQGRCLCPRPPPSWGRGQVRIWPRVTASAGTRTRAAPWPPTPSAPPTAPASTSPTSPTTAASGPYSAEKWRGIEYYYSSNVINFQTLVLQMILPRYLLTHFIRFV